MPGWGMDNVLVQPVHPPRLVAALEKMAGLDRASPLVFDEIEWMDRLMDDREVARRIVDGFLDDIPKQLTALESHILAADLPAARRVVHSINGAAATVSGIALQKVSSAMEEADDLNAMRIHVPELKQQFRATRDAMRLFENRDALPSPLPIA